MSVHTTHQVGGKAIDFGVLKSSRWLREETFLAGFALSCISIYLYRCVRAGAARFALKWNKKAKGLGIQFSVSSVLGSPF
jgi:hypothetical protein